MNPNDLIPGREYRHRRTKRVMVFIRREEVGWSMPRNFFRCPDYAGQHGPEDHGIIYAYDAEVETMFEPAKNTPAIKVKPPRLWPSELVVGRLYKHTKRSHVVRFLGHNGKENASLRMYEWKYVEGGQEFSNFESDFRSIQEVK